MSANASNANPNRRVYPRYEVSGVQGSLEGRQCEVVRLSLSGMLASCHCEPEPDRRIHLEFQIGEARVQSAGRVAFVGPDTHNPERGWHRIGIEFIAMSRRSRQALERYLAGLSPVEQRDVRDARPSR